MAKKVRNGLTQKQRKSRNKRIAKAVDMYCIHPNLPMRDTYYSTKKHPGGESL